MDGTSVRQDWERREGESAKAFAAFCHYRDLGTARSLDRAYREATGQHQSNKRARGRHSVHGMSNLVFRMLDGGWADEEICNELGMGPEELLRLKHITGFSKLFADAEYNRAWVTDRQAKIAREFRQKAESKAESADRALDRTENVTTDQILT